MLLYLRDDDFSSLALPESDSQSLDSLAPLVPSGTTKSKRITPFLNHWIPRVSSDSTPLAGTYSL